MTLKRFWVVTSVISVIAVGAIIYIAVGHASRSHKDSMLATEIVVDVIAMVNLAYRYRQIEKSDS